MDTPKPPDDTAGEQAHLGKSVVIKGEVTGSEDLYLDGQVDGAIDLKGNRLTIGPNGRVKANISARTAVIHGKLEGNIHASDRVDLKQSAIVNGDIVTQRISIDDGAFFKGGVDISRSAPSQSSAEVKAEAKPAPAGQGLGAGTGAPRSASAAALDPRK
jgi:cytoskeletal protein CcmA (bactofilin family)